VDFAASRGTRRVTVLLAAACVAVAALLVSPAARAHAATAPSAHCHVTDGAFGTCADGTREWSDVTPQAFPARSAWLYADQARMTAGATRPDTFMLMYDECSRTTALRPDEYFLINFDTVETDSGSEELERYSIHVFADGTLIWFVNGVAQVDAAGHARVQTIDGQRARAGFGPSPNCAASHLTVEFQIELTAAGGHSYSPDPIFWGATPPSCKVSALPAITDPQAQQIEAPETFSTQQIGGHPVRVSSRALLSGLSADMQAAVNSFIAALAALPGAGVPVINSAFRPQAYQDHLRAIRDRANQLGARVANGSVTFTNTDPECADLRNQIARELLDHRLGNNPVARVSDHGSGHAIDINPNAPAGTDIDALAAQSGLSHPLPVRDPVHFILSPAPGGRPGGVNVRSPVNVLLTDPAGRRVGYDPTSRSVVSEIPGATYSGPGSEPQAIELPDVTPGDYTISGVGTGQGPYEIEFVTADGDAVALGDATTTGTALFGRLIAPVVASVSAAGDVAMTVQPPPPPGPVGQSVRPGFDANSLLGNDDGSTGAVPLGFTANFFGTGYTSAFVNNNGNLTFDSPLSQFTPEDLTSTRHVIVAPFFADVDTRAGNHVIYGTGRVGGRPAFGITWPGVGCFAVNTSVLNDFQVVLVDRSDVSPGDFDIEFNYDQIQWETGQASGGSVVCQGGTSARAGFSNGSGAAGTFFELPGSGVSGAFLDGNPTTGLAGHSFNSTVTGRYLFSVRSGAPVTRADGDGDGVADELDNCPFTANPTQADALLDGVGDACLPAGLQHSTAAFLQANLDGTTFAQRTGTALADEPPVTDRLVQIVDFRVAAGLATSAAALTSSLVASLVAAGLVPAANAAQVQQAVVQRAADAQAPACSLAVGTDPASGHTQARVTLQDAGGLAGITVDSIVNATAGVPLFTRGTTAPVLVTATKVNNTSGASIEVTATDLRGNAVTCDPAMLQLGPIGNHQARATVRHLARAESVLTVQNLDPGISRLVVRVNGREFRLDGLRRGEARRVDLASAMRRGQRNTVSLVADGEAGGSALVMISDI
jgi:Nidogen-like/Thrombospondin type 3 repeat